MVVEDDGGGGDGVGIEEGIVCRKGREACWIVGVVAAFVVWVTVFAFVAVTELKFSGLGVGCKSYVR